MGDQTAIEWCDATFNPWEGCTKVGPGCDHCYAEVRNARFGGGTAPNWGAGADRRRTSPANWKKPLKWNAEPFYQCTGCSWRGDEPNGAGCPDCHSMQIVDARRRVFCASLADWLDNEVPIEWLVDLLGLIRDTPNLDWLLLTKRVGNWYARITQAHQHIVRTMGGGTAEQNTHPLWSLGLWLQDWTADIAPGNVWIGATVVNQTEAERDIPRLLKLPARVRFLSVEPMLGAVKLRWDWVSKGSPLGGGPSCNLAEPWKAPDPLPAIDWVIAGGESGTQARPTHPTWARVLRDQCAAAGVPFLFKQWGEWGPYARGRVDSAALASANALDEPMQRFGKKLAGRMLDGVEHNGFPVVA